MAFHVVQADRTSPPPRRQPSPERLAELLSRAVAPSFADMRAVLRGRDPAAAHGLLVVVSREAALGAARRIASHAHRAVPIPPAPQQPVEAALVLVPASTSRGWSVLVAQAGELAEAAGAAVIPYPPQRGLRALQHDYLRALRDAELAVVTVPPRTGIVAPGALVVARLLTALDPFDYAELTAPLDALSTLAPTHRQVYLDTITTVLRSDGIAEAAVLLHCHRNTVHYRMGRIRDLTGLDPDSPADRLRLNIAALAIELAGRRPAERSSHA